MNALLLWAQAWNIPDFVMRDLATRIGASEPTAANAKVSEAGVQSRMRLSAAMAGIHAWRNNVGAMEDPRTGRVVRFGLANDSAALSIRLKSHDLIGIKPHLISQGDVGRTIGQFWSRECKAPGAKTDKDRLEAQERFMLLVLAAGGDSKITSDPGDI